MNIEQRCGVLAAIVLASILLFIVGALGYVLVDSIIGLFHYRATQ